MSTVDWKSLEPPHTYLYSGPMSSAGERLNRFALSLKIPANRTAFLADPQAYVSTYSLTPVEADLVARRDWPGRQGFFVTDQRGEQACCFTLR